jgi:hypothetical protein
MAKGKGGKPSAPTTPTVTRNNGKKFKQNPLDGTSGRGKHTGKTINGYSPEKLQIRAERRSQ